MANEYKYDRVLLKLSGEALAGDQGKAFPATGYADCHRLFPLRTHCLNWTDVNLSNL